MEALPFVRDAKPVVLRVLTSALDEVADVA
jgi:hypothetical protein